MDMDSLKIKGELKEGQKLKAIVTISVETVDFGWVTLKGFRIWNSTEFNNRLQEPVNITPPSQRVYGRWINIFFVDDPEKWYSLEWKIYEWYVKERGRDWDRKSKENLFP